MDIVKAKADRNSRTIPNKFMIPSATKSLQKNIGMRDSLKAFLTLDLVCETYNILLAMIYLYCTSQFEDQVRNDGNLFCRKPFYFNF